MPLFAFSHILKFGLLLFGILQLHSQKTHINLSLGLYGTAHPGNGFGIAGTDFMSIFSLSQFNLPLQAGSVYYLSLQYTPL